jgi:phosphoglycolate phosphatase-like HAD superfamily hydrolase
LAKLISFDIDGTLEVGDPPGAITMDMVRKAQSAGFLIGSCSDRPISNQERIWKEHGIVVSFTILKQKLADLKARFQAEEYYHIGDSEVDRYVSKQAGFHFLQPDDGVRQLESLDGNP